MKRYQNLLNSTELLASLLFFLVFLSSCQKAWFSQDPLSSLPSHLQEGVLETGSQHFSQFDDFILNQMLKLRISNQKNSVLTFKEGEESVYEILFDLVNDFDSKYGILHFENPFSHLEGASWNYDPETQKGELRWTPAKAFNKGEIYKKIDILIPFSLRKRAYPSKNDVFNVIKNLDLFVYKNTSYKPDIVAVRTKYKSYIKLEDNKFYEDTFVTSLNLNYYDELFLDIASYPGNVQYDFSKSNTSEGEESVKHFLLPINPQYILKKDLFVVFNKENVEIPQNILQYIQRSYYELVSSSGRSDCLSYQGEDFCFVSLVDPEKLSFDKEVYVKNYQVPNEIEVNKVYYKIDSPTECALYNRLSYFQGIKDSVFEKIFEDSDGQFCYIASNRFGGFKNNLVSDSRSLYLLEDQTLKPLDITEWEPSYEKLPLFLKFQMNGYQAVKKIKVSYTNQTNWNVIFFKIKDENHFESLPDVFFENIMRERVYSLLPVQFKFESGSKIDVFVSEVEFSFDVQKHNTYKEYSFQITPQSGSSRGDSLLFEVAVFPTVLRETEYLFSPHLDIENINEGGEWLRSINLSTQIKRTHRFPVSFYRELSSHSLVDIDWLKENLFFEETGFKSNLCSSQTPFNFMSEKSCSCLPDRFYEDEEQNIYRESTCQYFANFKLLPSHLENKISGYVQHKYEMLDQEVTVLSFDASRKQKTERVLSIDKKSYIIHEEGGEREEIENSDSAILHLFFNLKPEWQCESVSGSQKKVCVIKYPIQERQNNILVNRKIKSFLEDNIIVESKCFTQEEASVETGSLTDREQFPCHCEKLNVLRDNIHLTCTFEGNASIELKLKSLSPHIYFFNTEEGDRQTPSERLFIN